MERGKLISPQHRKILTKLIITITIIMATVPGEGSCLACGGSPVVRVDKGRRHFDDQVQSFFKNTKELHFAHRINVVGPLRDPCSECLKDIREIWDLNEEIIAIQRDMRQILEKIATRRGRGEPKGLPKRRGSKAPSDNHKCPDRGGKRRREDDFESRVLPSPQQDNEEYSSFAVKEEVDVDEEADPLEIVPTGSNQYDEFLELLEDNDTENGSSMQHCSSDNRTESRRTKGSEESSYNSESDSDSYEEEQMTRTERKLHDWVLLTKFPCLTEARNFVKAEYVYMHKYDSTEGCVMKYRCRKSVKCLSKRRILVTTSSEEVKVHGTVNEHTHDSIDSKERGIPKRCREEINRLFQEGVKKPRMILTALGTTGFEVPNLLQLRNYLAHKRRQDNNR